MSKFKYTKIRARELTAKELLKRKCKKPYTVEGYTLRGLGVGFWVEIATFEDNEKAVKERDRITRKIQNRKILQTTNPL